MRTYTRDQWQEAQALWSDFSPEWREVRHRAAMRGLLYPPTGTRWDSWTDDEPSQRAILIRAIRETPVLLLRCIDRANSWSQVIAALVRARDEWRDEQRLEERRECDDPTHTEAVMSLGAILARVEASRG